MKGGAWILIETSFCSVHRMIKNCNFLFKCFDKNKRPNTNRNDPTNSYCLIVYLKMITLTRRKRKKIVRLSMSKTKYV